MDEKQKHINELKEFYKKKDIDTNPKIQKKEMKSSKPLKLILKYGLATVVFGVFVFFIVFMVDNYLVPSMVHTRAKVKIPSIEGLEFAKAESVLSSRNLKIEKINERYDPDAPENTVLRQTPEAEKVVKENRVVYVTVSKGVERIVVPYIEGMLLREARVKLLNRGLRIGKIDYRFSESVPADTIIAQSIKQNSETNLGETVDLVVSKGSENELLIPDLYLLDFDSAEDIINSFGLRLGTVNQVKDSTFIDGTIINQFPPAGEVTIKNSYIDIDVVNNR